MLPHHRQHEPHHRQQSGLISATSAYATGHQGLSEHIMHGQRPASSLSTSSASSESIGGGAATSSFDVRWLEQATAQDQLRLRDILLAETTQLFSLNQQLKRELAEHAHEATRIKTTTAGRNPLFKTAMTVATATTPTGTPPDSDLPATPTEKPPVVSVQLQPPQQQPMHLHHHPQQQQQQPHPPSLMSMHINYAPPPSLPPPPPPPPPSFKARAGGGDRRHGPRPESYKTVMCQAYLERRQCAFAENCRFAHGENELRPAKTAPRAFEKYRTKICEKYTTIGVCPYGARCLFIHPGANGDDASAYIRPDKLEEILTRDPHFPQLFSGSSSNTSTSTSVSASSTAQGTPVSSRPSHACAADVLDAEEKEINANCVKPVDPKFITPKKAMLASVLRPHPSWPLEPHGFFVLTEHQNSPPLANNDSPALPSLNRIRREILARQQAQSGASFVPCAPVEAIELSRPSRSASSAKASTGTASPDSTTTSSCSLSKSDASSSCSSSSTSKWCRSSYDPFQLGFGVDAMARSLAQNLNL